MFHFNVRYTGAFYFNFERGDVESRIVIVTFVEIYMKIGRYGQATS